MKQELVGTPKTAEEVQADIARVRAAYFGPAYNHNSFENTLDRDMKFCSYGINK